MNCKAILRTGAASLTAIALATATLATPALARRSDPAAARTASAPASTQTAQPTGETGWNIPVYDIPADPAVTYGRMDNGMRYAIMRNDTPRDSVALRMRFGLGSIAESDSERGLAHFIEHMAFNGSRNVPEGEMVKLLEREGLAFGADTNASTGFDQTVYQLDLPRADRGLLDTGLMLMRETASNLTIAPEAVNRERGVILSEMRTRDSFNLRQFQDYAQFAAPGTPFGTRLPIGTTDVLNTATAAQLRSLYERYYRPENATLVVVGDVDPAVVEAEIRQHFADWQPVGKAGAPLDPGMIDLDRPEVADIFVDPAVPYSASIDRFSAYDKPVPTVADLRKSVLQTLGASILSRRIEKLSQQPDTAIIGGGAGISGFQRVADRASISISAKEGEWEAALRTGEQELRRATQYGFTQAELAEQLANMEQYFRKAAAQQDTRRSGQIADAIVQTVAEDDLFVLPSVQLDVFERIKPQLTLEAVDQAFRAAYTGSQPVIFVTSKTPIEGGAERVLADYNASEKVAVSAPAASAARAFAYTDFGTPGTIAADSTIPDLGIRTIRFANNVMLNLKRTDFERGKLRYTIDIGRGQLALPADEPGLGLLMSAMLAQGGLGKHSFDELQSLTAGEDVALGLDAGLDNFGLGGSTKMADFERQMELAAAFLTDPGYRPEMGARWQALVPPFAAQMNATPQQVAQARLARVLASGDPRFGIPDGATLLQRTPEELHAALDKALKGAPIEIAVVGDFDPEAVIRDVAKTFGALPARRAEFAPTHGFPGVSFPTDTTPVTLYHEGTPDQGLAMVDWPTTDDTDAGEVATLNLLAQVMQLDLTEEIREKLGASYSPSAYSNMSDTFARYGVFGVNVVIAPQDRRKVFDAVDGIAAHLRDGPVDADTLQRARAPLLEQIAKSERENGYWIGVAQSAQSEADRLDRYRTRAERYRAVTADDLRAAARRYLQPGKELRIAIVHESLRGE